MELFTNSKKERLTEIIEYFIDNLFDKYGNCLGDIIDELYSAGFTRNEILEVLNKHYLDSYDWGKETKTAPTPNIEDVDIGDSDRAILETALTQIGIPYSWEQVNDDDGNYFADWINLKVTGYNDRIATRIYFTKDGTYDGTYKETN